uniref:Uncharacterized protein n=1 Tax=Chromera velia CCMP2878 TaxID=1169474 RepID=A0A0G4I880_9ALVE|eukprot:Cvel_11884.t1-p1 / transcript=Cvel_11884.t1 / gene=Cvel_11884 / organism=Chromera_velia_CCMP2878 / gene_product=hypothetical protein / transcript_product=hypothetical protein / location=Cvel_scaffold759:60723-61118(-) / protein_length=132 / sequence_SO=supercontig / SO=protein_coding / is_pseudo=false
MKLCFFSVRKWVSVFCLPFLRADRILQSVDPHTDPYTYPALGVSYCPVRRWWAASWNRKTSFFSAPKLGFDCAREAALACRKECDNGCLREPMPGRNPHDIVPPTAGALSAEDDSLTVAAGGGGWSGRKGAA